MKQALQVRFLGMAPSESVETLVRAKADKLDLFCADIISCRVTVEQTHKHQQKGRPFAVRLDLTMPGHELSVDRVENEDVYVALRDAFEGMKRQVEDVVQRQRDHETRAKATDIRHTPDAA
jgi:ribosome-associated translation inhibitor RaiA